MRASGILLPISSLPGKYGIGSFSKEAYKFVDFLRKSLLYQFRRSNRSGIVNRRGM